MTKPGRPVTLGRYTDLPARMQAQLERNLVDAELFDLRPGLALMEAIVAEEGRRLAEGDTPSFRERALELYKSDSLGELAQLLADGQVTAADHARFHAMVDRTQTRREAAWTIKLTRDKVINADDLTSLLIRWLSVIERACPNRVLAASICAELKKDVAKVLAERATPVEAA